MTYATREQRDASRARTASAHQDGLISVLVIDDTCLEREALAELLRRTAWSDAVVTAGDAEAAVRCIRCSTPDVILLNMSTMNSVAILKALVAAAPRSRVLALGVTEAQDDVVACAEAGVAGYLPRSATLEDLVAVVQSALRGETLCSPQIAATLLRRVATLAGVQGTQVESTRLTARERQIVVLIDHGLTNKQIADSLCIEVYTVKNHVHNILEKLRVHRRGEAAARMRSAWVPAQAAAASQAD
jgi:DNA-binding NarL/FixJ family response regulator